MGRDKKIPPHGKPSGAKVPTQQQRPSGSKRPWSAPPDGGFDTCHPLFSLEHLDLEGPFGWGSIGGEKLREVTGKMREFEKRTWAESKGSKRIHSIDTHKLSKEARDRLAELDLDDQTCVFSVGVSGAERIFGVRFEAIFFVLWWDPLHQVCPSILKNT